MEGPLKGYHVFRELQMAYHAWMRRCKLSVDTDMPARGGWEPDNEGCCVSC